MVLPIALTGTVGVILNNCFNRVEDLIDDASNGANVFALTVGCEMRKSIEKAKVAYKESLDYTLDEVDIKIKKVIKQLATLASDLQKKTDAQLKTIAQATQLAANLIPFSNQRPLVTKVYPQFVVINKPNQKIKFKCHGNFPQASSLTPTLTFKGHQANLLSNNLGMLKFEIEAKEIFDKKTFSKSTTFSFMTGELEISWIDSNSLPSFSSIFTGIYNTVTRTKVENPVETFKITLGALPPSPGVFKLQYTTLITKKDERKKKSENKHLDSCKGGAHDRKNDSVGGHNHKERERFSLHASDGWTIKPGTVTNTDVVTQNDGVNTSLKFISADEHEAIFEAATEHGGLTGHSGIMDFCIEFIEWQDIKVPGPKYDIDISNHLGWGKEYHFDPQKNWDKWKVVFTPFDSTVKQEFEHTVSDNDRIEIKNKVGGGYSIIAKIPDELIDD